MATKGDRRATVLAYLEARKQQIETDMGAEDISEDRYRDLLHDLAMVTGELVEVRTSVYSWVRFIDDAEANGF